jgi:HD-GYP domain-containing protein (c-di-GMP phosphodiesterase class II)
VQFYVGAVTVAALAFLTALSRWHGAGSPPEIGGLLVFVLGIVAIPPAGYCLICIGRNVAVNMAGTVMFAMMLLLPPAFATAGAAAGMVILAAVLRWPLIDILFNASQTALTVGAAAAVFTFANRHQPLTGLGPVQTASILAAVATFYIVNSAVVTQWSVLLRRSTFLYKWKTSFGRSAIPYLSTLLLGVVVAITYRHAPVFTPILILPIIAVYRSLQNANVIRVQAKETIELLADTVDRRDAYTYAHSQRVYTLARRIAERVGLPAEEQDTIARVARVHDLGKVGVSDGLLLKSDRLSPSELEIIRKHTVTGAEIVGKLPEYKKGKEYILFHHERYDGTGIFGLRGQHIPLGARIIAAADAYDAMTSDRPYRQAMSMEEALQEIERQKGRQFDPLVADVLIGIVRQEVGNVHDSVPVTGAATPLPRTSPAPS